ncbi:MAG: hypothetical protein ACOY94_00125 [Bacillota bacterium]
MTSLILAVLLAATAAFLGNRRLIFRKSRWALVAIVPFWEETCKAMAVWALPDRPVLAVHLLFGLLELAYSAWRGERFLGLVGLTIHGLVGGGAAWLVGYGPQSYSLGAVTLGAALLHMLLNLAVLGLVFPTLGLPGLISNFSVDHSHVCRYNEQE